MADLTVELDPASLKKLVRRLGAVRAQSTLRPPMQRAVARLQRDLADYPAPARKPQPAKTRAQRIKQILLAKEGKIPYRRTGTLGRAWTGDVSDEGAGVVGTVGNRTQYGPLVQGAGSQAAYHAGNWGTEEQALARHADAIFDDFADALDEALAHG